MDVGVYGRLSIAKAETELTELAIERQHERATDYARAKGWTVARRFEDLEPAYRRKGRTRAPRRDGFERALSDVEAGAIEGLVFFKLDRLVRDHGDFERALAVAERHGAVLASVTEPLDTSTPMGEAVARLLVTFARLESQTIGLRVAAQAEQAATLGKPWLSGRHRPYGYDPADRVTVLEEEAAVVRELAARLLDGQSLGQVVAWLEETAVPAPAGGHWNRSKVRSLLSSPHLAGRRVYHGQVVAQGIWEPILEEEDFERLGRLFQQRKRPGRPALRWLLSGIVCCGACGAIMETRGHAAGPRYVCDKQSTRVQQVAKPCGRVSIVAAPVDLLVAERVLDRLAGPALERQRRQLDTAALRAIALEQDSDRQALVQAARERFVDRTLNPAAYAEVRVELERRIAEAERRLAVDSSGQALANLPRLREDLDRFWAGADVEQRREVVRAVAEWVEIHPATRRGAGLDPDRVVIPKAAWKV